HEITCYLGISSETFQRLSVLREKANLCLIRMVFGISRYRLKAGLSYQLSPEISAFAGGFYHRVVGDGVYDDLPAQRLVDDTSPAGRTKDTAKINIFHS
ncbi:P44 outer membrane protein, partial [Anaplasma phagocytophilum str. HGE1]